MKFYIVKYATKHYTERNPKQVYAQDVEELKEIIQGERKNEM